MIPERHEDELPHVAMLHHAARDDSSGPTVLRLRVRLPGVVRRLVEGLPGIDQGGEILHPPAIGLDAKLVPEEPELLPPRGDEFRIVDHAASVGGLSAGFLDVGFTHGLQVRSGG